LRGCLEDFKPSIDIFFIQKHKLHIEKTNKIGELLHRNFKCKILHAKAEDERMPYAGKGGGEWVFGGVWNMVESERDRSTCNNKMFQKREENAHAQVKMTFGIKDGFDYANNTIYTWDNTWNFHLCPNGEISQNSLSCPVVHKAWKGMWKEWEFCTCLLIDNGNIQSDMGNYVNGTFCMEDGNMLHGSFLKGKF
jgi:hypothetical protein